MIDSTTVAVGSYGTGSYIFTILIHSPTRSVGTSLPIFQYLFLGTMILVSYKVSVQNYFASNTSLVY
jgi:hypothetical protein